MVLVWLHVPILLVETATTLQLATQNTASSYVRRAGTSRAGRPIRHPLIRFIFHFLSSYPFRPTDRRRPLPTKPCHPLHFLLPTATADARYRPPCSDRDRPADRYQRYRPPCTAMSVPTSASCAGTAPPTPGTCVAHGNINLKTKSLFSCKFRPVYWTLAYPTTLICFSSKRDFALWLTSKDRGNGVTSSTVDVLDSSVRACLNLDPAGIIQQRERKERRRLEKEARKADKKEKGTAKAKVKPKKSAGLAAADAASKYAERYSLTSTQASDGMYLLNIQKTAGRGSRSEAFCFGSRDPSEIEALREALSSALALVDGDEANCKFIPPAVVSPLEKGVNGRPPRPAVPKEQNIAEEASSMCAGPDDSFCTSLSAPLPRIAESSVGSEARSAETRSAVSAAS